MEFIAVASLVFVGEVVVHLVIADHQLALDFPLTQAIGDELTANLFAEFFVIHTISFELVAKFVDRRKIFFCFH